MSEIEGSQLLQRIKVLRDTDGKAFIKKFTLSYLLSSIERQQIEVAHLFSQYKKDGFDLHEFVRFFLNIIHHRAIETLYLTIALTDLFNEITKEVHVTRVSLTHLTDLMCQRILKGAAAYNTIQAKVTPLSLTSTHQPHTPVVYGGLDLSSFRLCPKSIKMDCGKRSKVIVMSHFCPAISRSFLLESLAQSIQVYDQNCRLLCKVRPNKAKLRKEVIILSFAFSCRQYRLGAALRDFSLKFWDHQNNFDYEKTIATISESQQLQTGIGFLEYFDSWLTWDKQGVIGFWSLTEERVTRWLRTKHRSPIHGLTEVAHLNLLVLAQETPECASVLLYSYSTGALVTEIALGAQRLPHTIRYSETYQVLLTCGLEKSIKVFELHPTFKDAALKSELIGHDHLVLSFCLLARKPLLVSSDDHGYLKVWDFRTRTCLQTIDFNCKTLITNLLDMSAINKVGIFGARINYLNFQRTLTDRPDTPFIQAIDIDEAQAQIYAFGNSLLRVLDMNSSRVKRILNMSTDQQQQFTCFKYFSCLNRFVLGSSNGEISVHETEFGSMEYRYRESHEAAVFFIEYDEMNKLVISGGADGRVLVHRERECLRQMRNHFPNAQLNLIEMSVHHNFIAVGSTSCQRVYFWNYEYGKIENEIALDASPLCIRCVQGPALILISTASAYIYVFQLVKTKHSFCRQLYCIERNAPVKTIEYHMLTTSTSILRELVLFFTDSNTEVCKIKLPTQSLLILPHYRNKQNYYPYRESKDNFQIEIEKKKHVCFRAEPKQCKKEMQKGEGSGMGVLSLMRIIKMNGYYLLGLGGQGRRIKIWDKEHRLLCDANIKYHLPYKWQFRSDQQYGEVQKIYAGIKLIQSVSQKYRNSITMNEAKNIELRELINYVKESACDTYLENNFVDCMLTEPVQKEERKVLLLQEQCTRKDLNFDLVKQFNFKEIAGPALKEMDYSKSVKHIQKEWRLKEVSGESEKNLLMRTIQLKAQRNQEKQQLQHLFTNRQKNSQNIHKNNHVQDKYQRLFKDCNTLTDKKKGQTKIDRLFLQNKIMQTKNDKLSLEGKGLQTKFERSNLVSTTVQFSQTSKQGFFSKKQLTQSQEKKNLFLNSNSTNAFKLINLLKKTEVSSKTANQFSKSVINQFNLQKNSAICQRIAKTTNGFRRKKCFENYYIRKYGKTQQSFHGIIKQMNVRVMTVSKCHRKRFKNSSCQ